MDSSYRIYFPFLHSPFIFIFILLCLYVSHWLLFPPSSDITPHHFPPLLSSPHCTNTTSTTRSIQGFFLHLYDTPGWATPFHPSCSYVPQQRPPHHSMIGFFQADTTLHDTALSTFHSGNVAPLRGSVIARRVMCWCRPRTALYARTLA
jgi:hypothetical protein